MKNFGKPDHNNCPWFLNLLTLVLLLTGGLVSPAKGQQRYEYRQPHMGTIFRIVLYAPDSATARQAAQEGFQRVAQLNTILSDYLPDSELNRLCRTAGTGQWVQVSPDLWHVLFLSDKISRRTRGAFDVTIGPYVQLWRRARRQGQVPAADARQQAKQAVGYTNIRFKKRCRAVQLIAPGMQLDLGAIGKGYAVDEALKVITRQGIRSALVDGGGNIVVSAAPPGKAGWEVSLPAPSPSDSARQLTLHLQHQAVASSGDLYQYLLLDGLRYSHILSPFTGLGLTDQSLVSVLAPDGTTADWLSTAISVLGPEKGLRLANRTRGAAAIFTRRSPTGLQQWHSRRLKTELMNN